MDTGMHLTLAECRALWSAMAWREVHLSQAMRVERDEDRGLELAEESADLDGARRSLMAYARSAYGWDIAGDG